MPISTSDLQIRLSGGASNTVPSASIGGALSSQQIDYEDVVHNVFDPVLDAEASLGAIDYRCVYVTNADAARTAYNVRAHILGQSANPGVSLALGVGVAAAGATEAAIADESVAPDGVTFSSPSLAATAVSLGTLAPGQGRALWLRRTTAPGTTGIDSDIASIRINYGSVE